MTRKLKHGQYRPLVLVAFLLSLCHAGQAQEAPGARPSTPSGGAVTLLQNVRIFDGKSTTLSGPRNMLVRGNKIERISTDPIPTDGSATTMLIDGGGRTLMPGLIDLHVHVTITTMNLGAMVQKPPTLVAHEAAAILKDGEWITDRLGHGGTS